MNPSHKKELINAYKQKTKNGGVYVIRCTANDKRWIEYTQDLTGAQNRFDFSVLTDSCIYHALQPDWKAYGPSAFLFEVLEAVPQKENVLPQDYQEELILLRDCLRAEYPADKQYM